MPQKKVSATIHVTAVIDGQDGQPGAEGNGIQSVTRTYAVSSQATTASDTTPPSDITTWAAASPATTVEKPYLWTREVVTYTKAAATTKYYMIGARGQNGIDAQDIEWAYIRTKGNTPPRIADSSGTDSNGNELVDDDYMPSAYIESTVAGGIEANDINSSDHPNTYGSNNYICGECTDDPKGVDDEWPYEWEIKREKGTADSTGHRTWQPYSGAMTLHNNLAESLLTIDIDNDSDQFGVDADGKVLAQQARSTVVSMAYGTEAQVFTASPTVTLRYDNSTTVPSTVATASVAVVGNTAKKQYRITVTIKATGDTSPVFGVTGRNGLYVDISGTCARGTKSIRFSLTKVMGGASGENPVIWQINPSKKSFVFGRDASNNLTPASVTSSIYVTRTVGNTTTEHTSASGLTGAPTFSWGFDSSAAAQASGQAIGTAISISNTQAASHSSVWVKLSTGDRETLPILKDGAKGEDGDTVGINLLDGTNLVINKERWQIFDGTVQGSGAMGQKCIFKNNSSGSNYVDMLRQIIYGDGVQRIMPSTWYTLSFWLKGSGTANSFVYPSCVDTAAGCYRDGTFAEVAATDGNMSVAATNTWTRHTFTFKTVANLEATQYVLFRAQPGATVYLSAMKLEMGQKATDWCLSEADKAGQNAVRIDLDNQADIVAIGSDGKIRFDRDIVVQARIYDGRTQASTGVTQPSTQTAASLAVNGVTPTVQFTDGVLTVTWPFRTNHIVSAGRYAVSLQLIYNGTTYDAVFTLTTSDTAAIYQLKPSMTEVAFSVGAGNAYVPSSVEVTCECLKSDGNGTTIINNANAGIVDNLYDIYFRMIAADGTYNSDSNHPNGWYLLRANESARRTVLPSHGGIDFALGQKDAWPTPTDAQMIDIENVPVVKGGTNGIDGVGFSATVDYYAVSVSKDSRPVRWTGDDGEARTFVSEAEFSAAIGSSTAWATTGKTTNADTPWLWNFEKHSMSNGSVRVTPVHRIGTFAKGIKEILEFYALSQYEDEERAKASIWNPSNWEVDYDYFSDEYDSPQYMWGRNARWWIGPSMLAVTEENYVDEDGDMKYYGYDMEGNIDATLGYYGAVPTYYRADGNINRAPTANLPYQWNWERIVYTDGTYENFFHISARIGSQGPSGAKGDTPIALYRWFADTATVSAPTVTAANYTAGTNLGGWSKTAPDRPATGTYNLYMSQNTLTARNTIGAWSTPVRISGDKGTAGEDADNTEWIYKYDSTGYDGNTGQLNPTADASGSITDKNQKGWVPNKWYDHALSVTLENQTVYASYRVYDGATKTWGAFQEPIVWSHYGERGMDGDGTEYVFIRTNTNTAPRITNNDSYTSGEKTYVYTDDEFCPMTSTGDRATDDPQGTDSTHKFEWVATRQKVLSADGKTRTWPAYELKAMKLWSTWSASQPYYIQTQEAWGNSTETYPTSGWQDSTPEKNGTYLWRRSRTMTLQESTRTYTAGTWSYQLLSGTNGTSINVKGTVATVAALNNISNPADGDAYKCEADGNLYMWSSESGTWVNLGQFKGDPGETYYTHIAWARVVIIGTYTGTIPEGQKTTPNATRVTDFSVSPADGYDYMGVLVNTKPGTDSTDALLYTWKYVKGDDGTSPWVADIDNEMDSVLCGTDGKPKTVQTLTTTVRLWHGSTKEQFTLAAYEGTEATANAYTSGTAKNGVTVSWTDGAAAEKTVTVAVAATAQFGTTSAPGGKKVVCLKLTPTASGASAQLLYFTINASMPGPDGEPATVYNLKPSLTEINVSRASGGDYTPEAVPLTCGVAKWTGQGEPVVTADATGLINNLYRVYFRRRIRAGQKVGGTKYVNATWESNYYLYGNATYKAYIADGLNVTTYDAVEFVLCKSSVNYTTAPAGVVDRETVPVVADGKDGAGSVKLDLDNETETMLYDDGGNNVSGEATSQAYLYDGANDVTNMVSGWAIDSYDGVQVGDSSAPNYASISNSGMLTVTGISSTSGFVKVRATYNGTDYYAKMTLHKQIGGSIYKLVFTSGNRITYNATTGLPATSTVAVKVQRLAIGGVYTTAKPPSGYSLIFCEPGIGANSGKYVEVRDANGSSGNKGNSSTGAFVVYNAAKTEIRVVIGKLQTGTVFIDENNVLDSEIIPVTRVENGDEGPAVQVVVEPSPILFPTASDGVGSGYKAFKVSMKVNGNTATLDSITGITPSAAGVIVKGASSSDASQITNATGINAESKTLYAHVGTANTSLDGYITFDVKGTFDGKTYTATGSVATGPNKQGGEGPAGKDASQVEFTPAMVLFDGDESGVVNAGSEKAFTVKMNVNGSECIITSITGITANGGINAYVTDASGKGTSISSVTVNDSSKTLYLRVPQNTSTLDGSVSMIVNGISSGKSYTCKANIVTGVRRRGAPGQSITGDTGPMFMPMGEWKTGTTYQKTGELVPFVHVDGPYNAQTGKYGEYYYLNVASTTKKPGDGNNDWIQAAWFGLTISEGVFANFARLGSAVISKDWLFSANGTINGTEYNSTDVLNPAMFTPDAETIEARPAYTWFDAGFPQGVGSKSIAINIYESKVARYTSVTEMFEVCANIPYTVKAGVYVNLDEDVENPSNLKGVVRVYCPKEDKILASKWFDNDSLEEYVLSFTPEETCQVVVQLYAYNGWITHISSCELALTANAFVPNYAVDLLTGRMIAARGNFIVEANGDVTLNNAYINGTAKASVIYRSTARIKIEGEGDPAPTATIFYYNMTSASLLEKCAEELEKQILPNYLILTNTDNGIIDKENYIKVHLPSAHLFKGHQMEVYAQLPYYIGNTHYPGVMLYSDAENTLGEATFQDIVFRMDDGVNGSGTKGMWYAYSPDGEYELITNEKLQFYHLSLQSMEGIVGHTAGDTKRWRWVVISSEGCNFGTGT